MEPSRHGLFTAQGGPAAPEFGIGLTPIAPDAWFEGGEADPAARKDALLRDHPSLVWGEVEGSRAGQAEAAALVNGWLKVEPTDPGDQHPLWSIGRAVSDDLCLMEKRDGHWTLTAASLCAPSFFTTAEAVGRPLHALHAPVPGFNDALLPRVARIFDHLRHDQILERRNWTVVNAPDLFQPDPTTYRARLSDQTVEAVAASLIVRRERQTIRRLPRTGGVLFTIRIWRERLDELLSDPVRRTAFAEAWATVMSDAGAPFRQYKRLDLYDAAVRWRLDQS